jgi:hypothetical protein
MNKHNGMFSSKHTASHHGFLTVLELLADTVTIRVDGC